MTESIRFVLPAEDGWPPVALESIPFAEKTHGFEALSPPLFLKGLSVGDVIKIYGPSSEAVVTWSHVIKSMRSVAWLLRLSRTNTIDEILTELRKIHCNTVAAEELGCYSIDIPESVNMDLVDDILKGLDPDEVAVAFPSMRHSA